MEEEKKVAASPGNKFIDRLHALLEDINGFWARFNPYQPNFYRIYLLLERLQMELEGYPTVDEEKEIKENLNKAKAVKLEYGIRPGWGKLIRFCRNRDKIQNIKIPLMEVESILRKVMRREDLMIKRKRDERTNR